MSWLHSRPRKALIIVGPAAGYLVASSSYNPADGAQVTITAQLVDANNHSVHTAGKTITWSEPGGATGSFGSPTSVTDATGLATVTFTVSASPGIATTVKATDGGALTGTSATITTQSAGGARGHFFSSSYFDNAYFARGYFG